MMYYNGNGMPKNRLEAEKWLRKAAEQGHTEAQFYVGIIYFMGDGVKQDRFEAKKWLCKAAEQGLVKAQTGLGFLYYRNVLARIINPAIRDLKADERDKTEAIKWFHKAAQQGDSDAQNVLQQLGETWQPTTEQAQ